MSRGNNALQNVVTKLIDIPRTMTAGATLTNLSPALTIGSHKEYNEVKAIFPFVKAGSAAVTVKVAIQSDPVTVGTYVTVAESTYGTTAGTGYIATTGQGVAEITADMNNMLFGTNIKVLVTCVFTAGSVDTVIGSTLLQFSSAREEPPANTSMTTLS